MTTTDPTDEGPADQSGAELEWPERGRTLAVWLDHGRAAWLRLGTANQWQTAADSPLRLDDLTLHAGAKSSNSGWFARLTMLGAADMLRGVAALYASTPVVPLSRAHFPVVRSVQEHLGQVIWLLEPGIQITPIKNAPPITTHEVDAALFRARSLRAALLHWQFASDACSAQSLEFGEGSPEHTAAVKLRSEAKVVVGELGGDINDLPSPTAFANETIKLVYTLNREPITDATKQVYKRLSETAHGGLFGLYGDKTVDPATGNYAFTQDNDDLDAVARQLGIWWYATTQLVASAHGWNWPNEFDAWDTQMRVLFV